MPKSILLLSAILPLAALRVLPPTAAPRPDQVAPCTLTLTGALTGHAACLARLVASSQGNMLTVSVLPFAATAPAGAQVMVQGGFGIPGTLAPGSWSDATLGQSAITAVRTDIGMTWAATSAPPSVGAFSFKLTRLGRTLSAGGVSTWTDFDGSMTADLVRESEHVGVTVTFGAGAPPLAAIASATGDSQSEDRAVKRTYALPHFAILMNGIHIGEAVDVSADITIDVPWYRNSRQISDIRGPVDLDSPASALFVDRHVIQVFTDWYHKEATQERKVTFTISDGLPVHQARSITLSGATVQKLTIFGSRVKVVLHYRDKIISQAP